MTGRLDKTTIKVSNSPTTYKQLFLFEAMVHLQFVSVLMSLLEIVAVAVFRSDNFRYVKKKKALDFFNGVFYHGHEMNVISKTVCVLG